MPVEKKVIYLTFDDGPVPGPTEFVLDTLKRFNAKATFFCIGENICKHPYIFERISKEGHRAGNHTFNHLKGWSTEINTYLRNISQCDEVLRVDPKEGASLFRPPYGRITRQQIKSLTNHKIIMWDVLTYDYDKTISRKNCLKQSVNATRSGSIVVFHDSIKAEKNMMYTLPLYIDHFLKLGYSFESLKLNA